MERLIWREFLHHPPLDARQHRRQRSIPFSLITLDNSTTGTSFTDSTTTDGTAYNYFVSANNAVAATAGNSTPFTATTLPSPPSSAPGSLSGFASQGTNIVLNWSAVPGTIGYVVRARPVPPGPIHY